MIVVYFTAICSIPEKVIIAKKKLYGLYSKLPPKELYKNDQNDLTQSVRSTEKAPVQKKRSKKVEDDKKDDSIKASKKIDRQPSLDKKNSLNQIKTLKNKKNEKLSQTKKI